MTGNKKKSIDKVGIVYIMVNPAMPNLCKIGSTERGNLTKRITALSGTSVPFPFKCEYSCEVESYEKVEKGIHGLLTKYRVNPTKEFFDIEALEIAKEFLEKVKVKKVITTLVNKTINDNAEKSEIKAVKNYTIRPKFNFVKMGIKEGEIITYTKDESIKAKVVDGNRVEFGGKRSSLSSLTHSFTKGKYVLRPLPFWKYKGETLKEYYDKTYASETKK